MTTSTSRQCESGQITIMIIGFAVIAALAVGVVVNASSAFLQRRSLASWADGAALAGVQAIDHGRLYRGGVGESLPLSQAGAYAAVSDYTARHGLKERFAGFRIESVVVDGDGGRVTVRFAATVPLLPIGDVASAPVSATASATAPLTP